ncbi:MAG: hypothetical protein IV086_12345 [Hyphomonadaceae bacterium]|nr:MAG: hypothetical protein FD160_3197 [Caulobacteraceae bacterium]MBT9446482.1 hypothetical protein [Hyphomonadaceae bacterium]TPW02696.1 MAG: hypothetical protein FD124_3312 [Alphaproteobacteria bacterium]
MTNLVLSYMALFAGALLIGFAAGWLLRSVVMRGVRRDVEDDIDRLDEAVRMARARATLTG